jgi:ABC-type tungstate transport system substrate-binding protein
LQLTPGSDCSIVVGGRITPVTRLITSGIEAMEAELVNRESSIAEWR